MQSIIHRIKENGIVKVYQKYGRIIQLRKNLAQIMEQEHIKVDNMILCLLIEVITLLFIVIDLVKLITKKSNKYFKYFEIILMGMFIILFIGIFLSSKETEVLVWINHNSTFYLVYLLSTLIWVVLNFILYQKK